MAHDAKEGQKDDGLAEKAEAVAKARNLACGGFFLNGGYQQKERGKNACNEVDQEQNAPAHAERRKHARGAPHGYVGGEERGDGLDELTERKGAGKVVAADYGRDQRVERCLHQGVAYAEQRERQKHYGEALAEERKNERHGSHGKRQQYRVLAPDAVHKHASGH